MPSPVVLILFGLGGVLAVLSGWGKRGRTLWAALAEVCVAVGILTGLVMGSSLTELLTPVLLVCAVCMAAARFGKGGDGA